jgi:DNA-binding MarR family transcriptional regulator
MPSRTARPRAGVEDLSEFTRLLVGLVLRAVTDDESGLTLTHFRTLQTLDLFGEAKMRLLADRVGVHASTMSRTCRQLRNDGLVSQKPNPASAREVLISITAEGTRVLSRIAVRRKEALMEILREVPPAETEEVAAAMRTLVAAAAAAHGVELSRRRR